MFSHEERLNNKALIKNVRNLVFIIDGFVIIAFNNRLALTLQIYQIKFSHPNNLRLNITKKQAYPEIRLLVGEKT